MKQIKKFGDSWFNGKSRTDVIELLSNSSNFSKEELDKMSNQELSDLWNGLEMDAWLKELDEN